MANTVDETRLRRELVVHYKRVDAIGLNELSSGNLSVRFGERMLISANGASAQSITEDSIVDVSLDGDWRGERKPSSEWRMHAAIYRRHAAAEAIVHTHSDYCVAVASHLKPLPGFHYLVGVFGGDDVPCVPYSTFGTQALADDAAEALTDRTACLLGQHGMICRGPNLVRRGQDGPTAGDHVPPVRARVPVGGTGAPDGRAVGGVPRQGAGRRLRQEGLSSGVAGYAGFSMAFQPPRSGSLRRVSRYFSTLA